MKNFMIMLILLIVADVLVMSVLDVSVSGWKFVIIKIAYGSVGLVFGMLQSNSSRSEQ